jgi:hypothetical protein
MNFESWLPNNISGQTFFLAQPGTASQSVNAVDDLLKDSNKLGDRIQRETNSNNNTNQQTEVPGAGNAVGFITVFAIIGAVVVFLAKKFAEGAANRAGEDAYDRMTGRKDK